MDIRSRFDAPTQFGHFFGHLFQGRYKAVIVDGRDEDYFQVVSTYIHLNPVDIKTSRNQRHSEAGPAVLRRERWDDVKHFHIYLTWNS